MTIVPSNVKERQKPAKIEAEAARPTFLIRAKAFYKTPVN